MRRSVFATVKSAAVIVGSALLVCTAMAETAAPVARPPTPSYVSQVLGVLPGDNQSAGFGVNDAGSVVGYSSGDGGIKAFYWDRPTGVMSQLTTSGMEGIAYAIAGGPGATAYAVGYEQLPPPPPGEQHTPQHAVIWVAPPTSGPITLDGEGSTAFGVNDNGIAVGALHNIPAIWSPNGTNGYTRTDIALLPDHEAALALDINNDGIVVGVSTDSDTDVQRAFLRLLNGSVLALAPAQGDINSQAEAVSDVVNGLVYVAGTTRGASHFETRGVRWTVNVDTGAVVDQTVLSLQFALGVNGAGDVVGIDAPTHSHGLQSATLWQGGIYIKLEPPKGGRGGAGRGLARTASSPTYVVGETRIRSSQRAVVWDVN